MHTVSREELYTQVWAKPLVKVAADYGITGTALKKTCNRHHIPTPPLGYWAKLEHGKPVTKPGLPTLADPQLAQVRIAGSVAQRLPENVRSAKNRARRLLEQQAQRPLDPPASPTDSELPTPEPKILAATRRAISKARADMRGFATARGQGVVPLKMTPSSITRALDVLSQFVSLAEAQGYQTAATDNGLVLRVDEELIAFSIEEQSQKIPHEPTAAELREKDRRERWGSTSPTWAKYDHTPSGRLAIIIDANAYSGLRRTYADGKTRTLEKMLPEVLCGFAEHAAMKKERRQTDEERTRAWKEAGAKRRRQVAFEAREKRRMEFVDAVHEQLVERTKLSAVLSHLESVSAEDAHWVESLVPWVRRRLKQIDALIGPCFLDLSSRSAKMHFEEPPTAPNDAEDEYLSYLPRPDLQYWSIDKEKGLATATTPHDWIRESKLDERPNSDRTA